MSTSNGRALEDGLYPGMSRTEYETLDAVNVSTLLQFRETPRHAKEYIIHPKEPTDALDFGNAFHCAVLEPARFRTDYIEGPTVNRRTKAGKQEWLQFEQHYPGKEILSAKEMGQIAAMASAALENELVAALSGAPGKNEVCVLWTDVITGLRCKGLIDRLCVLGGRTIIPDFKTCATAKRPLFATHSANYGYHERAAWYLDGLDALAPGERSYWLIAVEKHRPYCTAVYPGFDDDSLEAGRADYREHLHTYKRCMETNEWPGYPNNAEPLRVPRWALAGVSYDAAEQRAE
jgi:hypothetical protein